MILSYLDTVFAYGLMLLHQLMQAAYSEILQQFVGCKFQRNVMAFAPVKSSQGLEKELRHIAVFSRQANLEALAN